MWKLLQPKSLKVGADFNQEAASAVSQRSSMWLLSDDIGSVYGTVRYGEPNFGMVQQSTIGLGHSKLHRLRSAETSGPLGNPSSDTLSSNLTLRLQAPEQTDFVDAACLACGVC